MHRSEEETKWIVECLRVKPPFSEQSTPQLERIAAAMVRQEFAAGTEVLVEGEKGDQAFLLEQGDLAVIAGGKEVDRVKLGSVFGEVSLVYSVPRTATVRAVGVSTCYVLTRHVFQATVQSAAVDSRKQVCICIFPADCTCPL